MLPYQLLRQSNKLKLRNLQHFHHQHHIIRLQSFAFSKPHNIKVKPSKITDIIHLPSPPLHFNIICILTGLIITGGSLYFLQENLLFGTMAGITAKTCTAPLERLTTHRQASIDTKYSIPSVIREIYKEEGMLGFWRGNGLNVFRASLQKGSLFAMNDFFRTLAMTNLDKYDYTQSMKDSPFTSFICGSLAGLTSTVITYPLDPVKTVNQALIHKQKWPAMTIWYSLATTRGYLYGPWIAGIPTFIGTSVYYGLKFLSFEEMVKGIDAFSDNSGIVIPTDLRNATAGLSSGIIGNAVTYPNNCVRKRMQTAHVCDAIGIESGYNAERYFKTALRLYYEGGVLRLYRGFGINLCRNAPNTAIQFVVYKRLQRMWSEPDYYELEGEV